MTAVASLIVAAGQGSRLGAETPKQYLCLGGIPILRRSVMAYRARGPLRVVIRPDDRALYDAAVAGLDLLEPVPGGATRQDSVRLGLESLAPLSPAAVLIHDAARPFVDDATIDRTIDALGAADAAIAALPVVDTLKREDPAGTIGETVPREGLWRAQTPQAFRFDAILAAHRAAAGRGLTDDAAVAEAAGLTVRLVLGDERNFKITTADDLARAERQHAAERWADLPEIRVGQGYDVHRLGPGTAVTLCGVRLDHDRALIGHSDADVGLHALVDAILGALGAGDIGQHFPPSDARWKGADSAAFLRHACDLVAQAGGRIAHLDVTLVCERPKIAPHREAMAARIGAIAGIVPARVSVKATTTEKLGFAGRGEGIGAHAVATVRLPAGP
jgi:2-C-methyl-D-erythritol 4-phosphate cytidylyltransferase/2-C-methyl-D-erythritol 2,4-cyclodiphosphate synthase